MSIAILIFICGAIIFRTFKIQYIERHKWMTLGERLGLKVQEINATRGNIYAEDKSLLATTLPFYQLAFDPSVSSDRIFSSGIDSLSFLLATYFKDRTKEVYKKKNSAGKRC